MPINPDVHTAIKKITRKRAIIKVYQDYYDGHHAQNYQSDKFRTMFGARLQKFRDNLCKTAVAAPCDRLEITGFSTQDKDGKTTKVYDEAWNVWKYSSMPRLAKRVHRDAFKTGDAYVICWTDKFGKSRIYVQDAYNCAVWYDQETDEVKRGAKMWRGDAETDFYYLTLYYPDRLEKYITKQRFKKGNAPQYGSAFGPRLDDENDPGSWKVENPIGICPMFHFGLESSILDDVIPLNDALNKECGDLLVGSEANSIRQRWTTGISYAQDEQTGKSIIPFENDGRWSTTEKIEGKFGEFTDVSLSEFLAVINDFRMEIARVTRIPAYYFLLDKVQFPSGEALEKSESPFTSLISDSQLDFGETWAAVMSFALINDRATPIDADPKTFKLETTWKPASPQSETQKLDHAGKKKNLGVSQKRVLQEIGYTDSDIADFQKENQEQAEKQAEQFGKMFDAGTAASGAVN
jgi:hypothetical protein